MITVATLNQSWQNIKLASTAIARKYRIFVGQTVVRTLLVGQVHDAVHGGMGC